MEGKGQENKKVCMEIADQVKRERERVMSRGWRGEFGVEVGDGYLAGLGVGGISRNSVQMQWRQGTYFRKGRS